MKEVISMAVYYKDIVVELREAGLIPWEVKVYIGSPMGPSTVLPLESNRFAREVLGVPVGIHLPAVTQFDYPEPGSDAHPDYRELWRKAADEIAFLRSMLATTGLPTDDLALARFFVLHEVGHWVHFKQEGEAPFGADLEGRQRVIQEQLPPQTYRQLYTEAWADQYALAQLRMFYAKKQEKRPVWKKIVGLLRRRGR
jgi:hypothetical protein